MPKEGSKRSKLAKVTVCTPSAASSSGKRGDVSFFGSARLFSRPHCSWKVCLPVKIWEKAMTVPEPGVRASVKKTLCSARAARRGSFLAWRGSVSSSARTESIVTKTTIGCSTSAGVDAGRLATPSRRENQGSLDA
jgi:hypothetical protein